MLIVTPAPPLPIERLRLEEEERKRLEELERQRLELLGIFLASESERLEAEKCVGGRGSTSSSSTSSFLFIFFFFYTWLTRNK